MGARWYPFAPLTAAVKQSVRLRQCFCLRQGFRLRQGCGGQDGGQDGGPAEAGESNAAKAGRPHTIAWTPSLSSISNHRRRLQNESITTVFAPTTDCPPDSSDSTTESLHDGQGLSFLLSAVYKRLLKSDTARDLYWTFLNKSSVSCVNTSEAEDDGSHSERRPRRQ